MIFIIIIITIIITKAYFSYRAGILYCFAAGENTAFGQRAIYENETKILQNII